MKRAIAIEALRVCAANGLTKSESARRLGLRSSTVSRYTIDENIEFVRDGRGRQATKTSDPRADDMARRFAAGETLKQIGDSYGITRERVRQLIGKYHGMKGRNGGQHVRAIQRREEADAKKDARYLAWHGCTFAQWRTLRRVGERMRARGIGPYRTPLWAFKQQRQSAKARGIGWELTLWQWWLIWKDSGHWEQRGRGQGYVMCRRGDEGPYSVGNVFIGLATENCSDRKGKKSGLPIGVKRARNRYVATRFINGTKLNLGSFDAPELAHAAYLAAGQLAAA